jgi:hypothetical protein
MTLGIILPAFISTSDESCCKHRKKRSQPPGRSGYLENGWQLNEIPKPTASTRSHLEASIGISLLPLDPELRVARGACLKHQMKGMFGGH